MEEPIVANADNTIENASQETWHTSTINHTRDAVAITMRSGQMPKYVEYRSYILRVGTIQHYMHLYESIGYPVQRKYLGEPLGFLVTEIGVLNKVVHMWGYDSLDDRAERRTRLFADQDWIEFLKQSWPIVETQTSELLRPYVFGSGNILPPVAARNG